MKVTCLHGYFIAEETKAGDVAKFNSFYDQDLVARDNYYTFEALASLPNYSILGKPLLNAIGLKTYSGNPWDVLEQNGYVYDFINGSLVPIATITAKVDPTRELSSFSTNGLIQPGSIAKTWKRITGFKCHLDCDYFIYDYSELYYA